MNITTSIRNINLGYLVKTEYPQHLLNLAVLTDSSDVTIPLQGRGERTVLSLTWPDPAYSEV